MIYLSSENNLTLQTKVFYVIVEVIISTQKIHHVRYIYIKITSFFSVIVFLLLSSDYILLLASFKISKSNIF